MVPLLRSRGGGHDHLASRRHHRHDRRNRDEDGFTLIELLIVLVILPLVAGAIAMVLITTLKNQQGIQGKITDSSAATTASAYYVRDIESAGSVTTAASPASAPQQCSASGVSGTPNFLLGLQLQGTQPAVVSYYELTQPVGPTGGVGALLLSQRHHDADEPRGPLRQREYAESAHAGGELHRPHAHGHPDRGHL